MPYVFKVWSCMRDKKTSLFVEDNNVLQAVLSQANEQLELEGSTLVLEKDGTPVHSEEVLKLLTSEVFILLQDGEEWLEKSDVCQNGKPKPAVSSIIRNKINGQSSKEDSSRKVLVSQSSKGHNSPKAIVS